MQATDSKVVRAKKLRQDKTIRLDDIGATRKISKSTLYRYLAMKPGVDGNLKAAHG